MFLNDATWESTPVVRRLRGDGLVEGLVILDVGVQRRHAKIPGAE